MDEKTKYGKRGKKKEERERVGVNNGHAHCTCKPPITKYILFKRKLVGKLISSKVSIALSKFIKIYFLADYNVNFLQKDC